ncbi:hypothetical protein [Pelagibaculum spongiae]|uniref:Outer membrane lipoprotein carrier protein LolA n=1 Tax=Pelagibaculum spongiae TaxID=2080658 RepID=A0A2V1GWW5_9GAMM|nr:hypothetical protein [Pelagibaculum spongiae]PVZ70153.1 hypothetical protein DC094_06005 [Pelagibaculum spongiae]
MKYLHQNTLGLIALATVLYSNLLSADQNITPTKAEQAESCIAADDIAGAIYQKTLTSGDSEQISYWALDDQQWFLELSEKTVHWQQLPNQQFTRSEWLLEQKLAIDYSHQDLKQLGELPLALPPVSVMPDGLRKNLFGRKTSKTWNCFQLSIYQGAPTGPTITLEWIDKLKLPLRYSVSLQGSAMWLELSELITKQQAENLASLGTNLPHQPFKKNN